MENEFITIAQAVKLTGQSDVEIMRSIKERLEQEGLSLDAVLRKEQTSKGFMYTISKSFLLGEPAAKKETPVAPKTESSVLEAKDEMIATLQKIVETKDRQMEDLSKKIDELIERDRETNILLKGLQDRLFLLEGSVQEKKQNGKEEKRKT